MRVLIDACVLYPTVMREVVVGVAAAGLFEPRWSPRLLEEWRRAAAKHGPVDAVTAEGEIARLTARFPRASVNVPDDALRQYWLPDPNDIHVLAAAVTGSCDAILTMNTKDFPGQILADEGLARLEPDGYLLELCDTAPDLVAWVVTEVHREAERLSGQPWDLRKLMKKARLPRLGKRLG